MLFRSPDIGTWLLKTKGDAALALQSDAVLIQHQHHWLVKETLGLLRRTLARLDVSSRSLFALVEQGSCFTGLLAELAFAADRCYMLSLPDQPLEAPHLCLSELNLGYFPMVNHQSRLQRRFYEEDAPMQAVRDAITPATLMRKNPIATQTTQRQSREETASPLIPWLPTPDPGRRDRARRPPRAEQ